MVRKYVRGAYQARYTFKIIYRVIPGNSNNKRLTADETLESFADWIINNGTMPQLEDGKRLSNFLEAKVILIPFYLTDMRMEQKITKLL